MRPLCARARLKQGCMQRCGGNTPQVEVPQPTPTPTRQGQYVVPCERLSTSADNLLRCTTHAPGAVIACRLGTQKARGIVARAGARSPSPAGWRGGEGGAGGGVRDLEADPGKFACWLINTRGPCWIMRCARLNKVKGRCGFICPVFSDQALFPAAWAEVSRSSLSTATPCHSCSCIVACL